MMEEKILTLHPDPEKKGVRIRQDKYEQVREAIIKSLQEKGALTLAQLNEAVSERLQGRFEGSIPWYVVTVKLDLEARGTLERIPSRQHKVLLK